MTDRAPAAPLYEAVIKALTEQGKSKNWLHKTSGIARNTLDRWRLQPNPPQAEKVIRVADALGIDRKDALHLGGVLPVAEVVTGNETLALSEVDTDVLLAEIRRRIPD